MRYKSVKYFTAILFVLGFINTNAQQDMLLYNMPAIQQSMYVNPSQMPQSKINIGLPVLSSVYFNLGNSGFRVTDLIKSGPGDSNHLDINNMLNKLGKSNYISQALQVDLLSFGIRLFQKNYISFSIVEKEYVNFSYPKNFLDWVWQGNGAFLGQNMNFNFGLNVIHYREYGIGYARQISDKLTVGGKLKYLYGMEDISAQNNSFTFNTDATDYGYTTNDNVNVNTSGFGPGTGSDFGTPYLLNRNNTGMAVDAGATYKLNDKFTFSASLIDLGYINWRSYTSNYTSNGAFNFDGVDITQFTSGDSNAFNKLTDSAKNAFNVKTAHKSYTTSLPAQVYLGANYKLSEKANAGLLLYGQFFNNILVPAVSASYNLKLTNWFSVSAAYSVMNRDATNVGVGFAVTGPVQFYVVSDNVIGFFVPQEVKTVNVRFGVNLCFGRKSAKAASDSTKASFQ